jgi:hypothetical protein
MPVAAYLEVLAVVLRILLCEFQQPVIFMSVMVGAALLVRLIQPTAARMGIKLMLMTLSALVLCQVRRQAKRLQCGCCILSCPP